MNSAILDIPGANPNSGVRSFHYDGSKCSIHCRLGDGAPSILTWQVYSIPCIPQRPKKRKLAC